jgi:L-threonylcarbamoyladenylate synthase
MINTKEINLIKNILNKGGVIAIPTDTVWGLACLPDKIEAVKKIYELKGRDEKKPLILMSSKISFLIPYIYKFDSYLETICTKYFPGQLTIVTQKSDLTESFITAGNNTVGIRVPDHQIFSEIAKKCTSNGVLATTSANLSNLPAARNKQEIVNYFGAKIDYIVDDFDLNTKGKESTVVKIENKQLIVLRQGSIIIDKD